MLAYPPVSTERWSFAFNAHVIMAMRKLLAVVWSVATHRRPFVPRLSPIPVTADAVTNNA